MRLACGMAELSPFELEGEGASVCDGYESAVITDMHAWVPDGILGATVQDTLLPCIEVCVPALATAASVRGAGALQATARSVDVAFNILHAGPASVPSSSLDFVKLPYTPPSRCLQGASRLCWELLLPGFRKVSPVAEMVLAQLSAVCNSPALALLEKNVQALAAQIPFLEWLMRRPSLGALS